MTDINLKDAEKIQVTLLRTADQKVKLESIKYFTHEAFIDNDNNPVLYEDGNVIGDSEIFKQAINVNQENITFGNKSDNLISGARNVAEGTMTSLSSFGRKVYNAPRSLGFNPSKWNAEKDVTTATSLLRDSLTKYQSSQFERETANTELTEKQTAQNVKKTTLHDKQAILDANQDTNLTNDLTEEVKTATTEFEAATTEYNTAVVNLETKKEAERIAKKTYEEALEAERAAKERLNSISGGEKRKMKLTRKKLLKTPNSRKRRYKSMRKM
jgi:hypothetical protein